MEFQIQQYFPLQFKFVAGLTLIGSLVMLAEGHPIWAGLLLAFSIAVLTTRYVLWVDKDQLKYRDYLWVMGAKRGEIKTCSSFDYVYLKKIYYSQKLNSRGTTNTVHKEKYQAFLKLGDDSTIDLGSSDGKEKKLLLAQKLANYLEVPLKDQTEINP